MAGGELLKRRVAPCSECGTGCYSASETPRCMACRKRHLDSRTKKGCTVCEKVLPISQFAMRSDSMTRHSKCDTCRRTGDREWKRKKTEEIRLSKYYKLHQYNRYIMGGLRWHSTKACEICGTTEKRLMVDHDHSNGLVRGQLCLHCNHGLGHFRDDWKSLMAAAGYILARTESSLGPSPPYLRRHCYPVVDAP